MDYVIIVAGGKGLRMGSEIPKQFLPVAGKPILMRTIERFHEYSPELNIILVLPESQQEYWHQLCQKHHFSIKHQIANGGDTRFQSSKNGLALVPDTEDGVVGFHDGVRPFVSTEVIDECYETAREEYAAIPVYAVTDTLRYIDQHGGGKNVLRSDYRVVQTPQAFDIGLAKQAFNQEYKEQFTDDASVVESLGCQVAMVDGNRENIKITTPFDIKIAEALLNQYPRSPLPGCARQRKHAISKPAPASAAPPSASPTPVPGDSIACPPYQNHHKHEQYSRSRHPIPT